MKLQSLHFQQFTKEHIPEYLQYAYHSFKANNPVVKNMSQLEFTQATAPALSAFIEAAEIINDMRGTKTLYNRFIRINGKMAMADFSCELHHFMKVLLPKRIFQIQYEAIPEVLLKEIPQFKGLMLIRMAIRIQFQGLGLYYLFEREKWEYLAKEGYEYGLHTVMNTVVLRRFQRYGAEVTHIKAVVNSKQVEFNLCKIQANKFAASLAAKSSL